LSAPLRSPEGKDRTVRTRRANPISGWADKDATRLRPTCLVRDPWEARSNRPKVAPRHGAQQGLLLQSGLAPQKKQELRSLIAIAASLPDDLRRAPPCFCPRPLAGDVLLLELEQELLSCRGDCARRSIRGQGSLSPAAFQVSRQSCTRQPWRQHRPPACGLRPALPAPAIVHPQLPRPHNG